MSWQWLRCAMVALLVIVLTESPAPAKRGSVAPAVNGSVASGGADCTICHAGGVASGSVQILGLPSAYLAGATYDLTVRLSDAAQLGGGFQLSVEDEGGAHVGALSIIDSVNTAFNSTDPNWVNHTSTGVANSIANWSASGSAVDYTVRWQAPNGNVGPVTFYAAGNAINDNNSLSGDNVYTTSETATFASVPAVSDWGVAIMVVLLMTAGTVVLRERFGALIQDRSL